MINSGQLGNYNMMLEWTEQENEDMDQESLRDSPTLHSLQQRGLLKFFYTSGMRANVRLLKNLISYWDQGLGVFDLQGEILEVIVEDMYFITRLSRRGILVNLEGIGMGGDPMSVQDYVDTYYPKGTQKKGSCIPIVHITIFPLQVVVSTVVRIIGSSSLHLATLTQMRIAVECMQGLVFDRCSGMISIMRK